VTWFGHESRFPILSLLARATLKGARFMRRPVRVLNRGTRAVSHLLAYRVPGERAACPACGSASLRLIEPLASARPQWRYGFVAGCRQCGLVFANPLPEDADLDAVYSPDGEWGRHRQEEYEKRVSSRRLADLFKPVAHALDVLKPTPGAVVLDFGCGLGGMLDAFAAAGWTTFGIDPATKVAFARHQELAAIPATAMCDVAILHQVLEHVTAPAVILRGMAGAVREGGHLLIGVPNLEAVDRHGEMKYCIRSSVHVLAYTTDCLAWLLADAGFRLVSSVDAPGGPRRRIVLARRDRNPAPKPREPLEAALAAFARYRRQQRSPVRWTRLFPVRMQAAYADLERSGWRVSAS
jgi:SAM-dependent methyltransferase